MRSSDHPIILFDGVCNYCNRLINFIIQQDKKGVFRFAPLQSESGQALLKKYGIEITPESFVLIEGERVFQKSTAALKVLNRLPWYWKEAQILRLVPTFLRDQIYDFVARHRYQWFGKKDHCMIPTSSQRERFLL